MQSKILYYPTIEFSDDDWVKSSLCIWDKIYRIVPRSYSPQDSDEVKKAIDAELVENIYLDPIDLDKTAKDFERFWNAVPFIPAGAETAEDEYVRLHPEKVDNRIRPILASLSRKATSSEWLKLNKDVANLYMLFLAETVSRRRGIPKLAHDQDMYSIMHYFQNNGNFDESTYNLEQEEATATLTLPNVMPNNIGIMTIDQILEFRNRTGQARANFRRCITEFSERLSKIEDPKFAKEYADEFISDLEKSQATIAKSLKVALSELPLSLLSVGIPTTLSAIGIFGAAPFDLNAIGKSCFIGAVSSIADASKSVRKLWQGNCANYLHKLNGYTRTASGVSYSISKYDRLFEEFVND